MSVRKGGKVIAGTSVKQSHNIGDIFFTSRTDTVLAGAVECDGATYDTTDFTGDGSIGELLRAGKLPYISLSQYDSDLTAHGSVRAFGWDGGSTTAFRVPTLQNVFLEAGQAASAGEYISAGLPNIKGGVAIFATYGGGIATGAFSQRFAGNTASPNTVAKAGDMSLDFNASSSSSIYGNSTTVQPNSVKYRAMVQLYNGATDEALETCTSVLADVAALKYDYVVDFQAPTAENNYTWFRKYKSGWVEQGGVCTTGFTVVLPVDMADNNYCITIGCNQYNANVGTPVVVFYNKTQNGFGLQGRWNGTGTSGINVCWRVAGFSA